MNLREFMRFHLIKALLALVALQVGIVAIVQNFNHRPVASSDLVILNEGKSIKVSPLLNDSDKDEGDELSLTNTTKPLHGKLEQIGNSIIYTPEKGFVGGDSLTYTISDGHKNSKAAYIVFQVNKNQKPVISQDTYNAYCSETIALDVTGNDKDPEGDTVHINGFSMPKYGNLILAGGQFIYTAGSVAVEDSFMYCISDGLYNSDSAVVLINLKPKNSPNYPWINSDIGNAAIAGNTSFLKGKVIMEGSGIDIWNESDGFQFAYQLIDGDCEMVTKVESLQGTHEWAKAGIILRESLYGGSKEAFICVSNKNGTACHQRHQFNEQMEGGNRTLTAKAPYWIKLKREGDSIFYYDSPDGLKWNNLQNTEVQMNPKAYIGFAVTSHENSELAKAEFSNFYLKGKVSKLK